SLCGATLRVACRSFIQAIEICNFAEATRPGKSQFADNHTIEVSAYSMPREPPMRHPRDGTSVEGERRACIQAPFPAKTAARPRLKRAIANPARPRNAAMTLQVVPSFSRIGEENAFAVLARATELQRQGRDIINLGIGQPDFPTPDHI